MVSRHVATAAEYLALLTPAERAEVAKVRKVIKANLPKGYVETINWGVICYEVPLKAYPNTYNGQPLVYAGLAAQKHYLSLYLMSVYFDDKRLATLKQAFADEGKKLRMGKGCIRFKKAADLPLPVIGKIIASTPMKEFMEGYDEARANVNRKKC